MAKPEIQLEEGLMYHIYNRANGHENLVHDAKDFLRFLSLMEKYIAPVADIFAWNLMPNHFHIAARIKPGLVYKYMRKDFTDNLPKWEEVKWETIQTVKVPLNTVGLKTVGGHKTHALPAADTNDVKQPNPASHIAHLCNAYARYYNEKYKRHGSLFQRPFRRKLIQTEYYWRQLILYIHSNAVHHGFVKRIEDYQWSSYHTYLTAEPSAIMKEEIFQLFGGVENFIASHKSYSEFKAMNHWLMDD